MFKFIGSLFARCPHIWVQYGTADIIREGRLRPHLVGKASFCQCEKCGERRLFKMRLG